MKHTVRVTVLDKKLYPELQREYCADPAAGACPCYNIGDEFIFYRDDKRDDFWHMGLNTLVHTSGDANAVLRRGMGRHFPLYLRGASGRMNGWMKRENEMIACCSDGTRPVVFKIERIDCE